MAIFRSDEHKNLVVAIHKGNFSDISNALKLVKREEIDSKFSIERSYGGHDNGNYSKRVTALGCVFHDAGPSDVAALLIEKGAKVTEDMARDLLSVVREQVYRYRCSKNKKPLTLSSNMIELFRLAKSAGIDWDAISVVDWDDHSFFPKKTKASSLIEREFGTEQTLNVGVFELDIEQRQNAKVAHTKRAMKG